MFVEKARHVEAAGALAMLVIDTDPKVGEWPLLDCVICGQRSTDTCDHISQNINFFTMSGDGTDDVSIPSGNSQRLDLETFNYGHANLSLSPGLSLSYSSKICTRQFFFILRMATA